MSSQTEQIRALNDQLRQNFSPLALAVMTSGVAALGRKLLTGSSKPI